VVAVAEMAVHLVAVAVAEAVMAVAVAGSHQPRLLAPRVRPLDPFFAPPPTTAGGP
jgi:hypothetical protein